MINPTSSRKRDDDGAMCNVVAPQAGQLDREEEKKVILMLNILTPKYYYKYVITLAWAARALYSLNGERHGDIIKRGQIMANLELLRETRVRADRQDGNSNQASISLSTKDCMSRHRNSKLSFSHLASPHFFVSGARRRWWERKGEGDKTKTENGRKNGDKKSKCSGGLFSFSLSPRYQFHFLLLFF